MSRAAVVTMVRDEAVFLPIWLGYYGRFFAPEEIYVLDHGVGETPLPLGGFIRIPVSHPTVDEAWKRDTIQAHQHDLIGRYEAVLVTDVDEIVAPDPSTGDLRRYIDAFTEEFVTCAGYEVLHLRDREPPFDRRRGVLEQRGWWFRNPAYSKPLLARVPMHWHGGMHARADGRTAPDDRLHLIHLHRMDYEICLARHRARASVSWNERDINEGWGYQNRIVEADAFERWFYGDSSGGVPVEPEPIPPEWRLVV
jgi:hypothetical protein